MDVLIRLGIVLGVVLVAAVLVQGGRWFVEGKRRQALAAAPLPLSQEQMVSGRVHILVFSSEDCRQCHTHQKPAIERVLALRSGVVSAEEIDAPNHPELTERYHILTVPSTVVLDAAGNAQVVNYGFAPTQQLLNQIDAVQVPALA